MSLQMETSKIHTVIKELRALHLIKIIFYNFLTLKSSSSSFSASNSNRATQNGPVLRTWWYSMCPGPGLGGRGGSVPSKVGFMAALSSPVNY